MKVKHSGFITMSPYRYPLYILLHPMDGFQEMKANKKGSPLAATVILAAWLLAEVFYRTFTDYDMNSFNPESASLLRVSLITILVFGMACLANWCFCTLLDGKGRMKDIYIVGAYCLLPYVIVRYITTLLSRVIVGDEQVILTYALLISQAYCALMILIGLMEIHEYTMKKVLLSVLLTAVGIVILLFLALALVMLFQQLYYFVVTISSEIRYY